MRLILSRIKTGSERHSTGLGMVKVDFQYQKYGRGEYGAILMIIILAPSRNIYRDGMLPFVHPS